MHQACAWHVKLSFSSPNSSENSYFLFFGHFYHLAIFGVIKNKQILFWYPMFHKKKTKDEDSWLKYFIKKYIYIYFINMSTKPKVHVYYFYINMYRSIQHILEARNSPQWIVSQLFFNKICLYVKMNKKLNCH